MFSGQKIYLMIGVFRLPLLSIFVKQPVSANQSQIINHLAFCWAPSQPENVQRTKKHFQIRNFALQRQQVRIILPPEAEVVWLWRNQIMSATFRLNKLTTSSWEKFNSCELLILNKIEKLCWNSMKVSRDKLFCIVHNDNISWKILNLNKF